MEYQLRLLKNSTWGISIKLIAEPIIVDVNNKNDIKVTDKIFVRTNYTFLDTELFYLKKGVLRFKKNIDEYSQQKIFILNITNIIFSETDFQEEGLFYVLAGWFAKNFNINDTEVTTNINFIFDKVQNKYLFPDLK